MRLLLFWILIMMFSFVQPLNVHLPFRPIPFVVDPEAKEDPSNQKPTGSTTHSSISSSSTSTSMEETTTTEEVSTPQPTTVSSSASPLSSSEATITLSAVTSSVISDGASLGNDSTQTLYTTSTSTTYHILHTTRTPSHTEPTTNTAGPSIPSSSASSISKPSHLGAIIGGIVGGVAFAFIIALIALLKWHRRRQISSVPKTAFNGDMMVKPPFNWRNVARSWKSRSIASSLPRRWHGSDYGYGGYSSSAVTSEDLVPKNGLAEKNGNEHKPPSEIDGDNGVL